VQVGVLGPLEVAVGDVLLDAGPANQQRDAGSDVPGGTHDDDVHARGRPDECAANGPRMSAKWLSCNRHRCRAADLG